MGVEYSFGSGAGVGSSTRSSDLDDGAVAVADEPHEISRASHDPYPLNTFELTPLSAAKTEPLEICPKSSTTVTPSVSTMRMYKAGAVLGLGLGTALMLSGAPSMATDLLATGLVCGASLLLLSGGEKMEQFLNGLQAGSGVAGSIAEWLHAAREAVAAGIQFSRGLRGFKR